MSRLNNVMKVMLRLFASSETIELHRPMEGVAQLSSDTHQEVCGWETTLRYQSLSLWRGRVRVDVFSLSCVTKFVVRAGWDATNVKVARHCPCEDLLYSRREFMVLSDVVARSGSSQRNLRQLDCLVLRWRWSGSRRPLPVGLRKGALGSTVQQNAERPARAFGASGIMLWKASSKVEDCDSFPGGCRMVTGSSCCVG